MGEIFTIILFALLCILVVVLIILGIKLITILNKADDLLDDVNSKMEKLSAIMFALSNNIKTYFSFVNSSYNPKRFCSRLYSNSCAWKVERLWIRQSQYASYNSWNVKYLCKMIFVSLFVSLFWVLFLWQTIIFGVFQKMVS